MSPSATLALPEIVPVTHGPTWRQDPDWAPGMPEQLRYVLPELTLGWQVLIWIKANLLADDGLGPFTPTFEQKRLLLWWYAVDANGRFVYRSGVVQRLKGWGKDPLAAVIAAVEFLGPCRFAGWSTRDRPDIGVGKGDPVGRENPRAWIQFAAVNREQTKSSMTIFPGLFSPACMAAHGMRKDSIGKSIIYAHGGSRRIEAVTASPRALEGARPSLVVLGETHHWLETSNEGHAMFGVIARNATKSAGGQSRTLSITNAYEPSEGSVAQIQREAWEAVQAGEAIDTRIMYDAIEAPEKAFIRPKVPKDTAPEEVERFTRAYIGEVLSAVRGDAVWLDIPTITDAILSGETSPSEARRFYYNQIVAAEDAWAQPAAVDAARSPLAVDARSTDHDIVRAGWLVTPDSPVVIFGDGSKSDDSTGLVGCELDTGYVFTIGVWQRPPGTPGEAEEPWRAPRNEVDLRLREAMQRFNVVAFWMDPSHTKDDDGSRYWDDLIDVWHRTFKDRLTVWAVKGGDNQHSVSWDMTSPERTNLFAQAAELFIEELETLDDIEEYAPAFEHDANPILESHMKNAKKYPVRGGHVSLYKGPRRNTRKKIDLAVCAVGARMLRRVVLNRGIDDSPQGSEVWGYR